MKSMKWIAALLVLAASRPVHAVTFYLESSTGISQLRSFDSVVGLPVQSPTNIGFSFGMALMASLSDGRDAAEFQLGVQPRMSSASDVAGNYTLLALYPVARLQLSRIYLAGGWTPWAYSRAGSSLGLDNFVPLNPNKAYFGEAGFLFPLVPDFSLGTAATLTWAGSSTTIDATFLMRFYLGSIGSASASSGRSSGEFKGWRYPFGSIR